MRIPADCRISEYFMAVAGILFYNEDAIYVDLLRLDQRINGANEGAAFREFLK